ncbi:ribosomal protein S5, C-terminal domain-containing protein [Geranomyces variabilis]|nr:ribosomal protein S5, C-terminal domain-containing protein [Geranomyces variabilis]KAJ3142336.1 28S ribosomal protein S5, mitochondrial [Geranomyces variabilis]
MSLSASVLARLPCAVRAAAISRPFGAGVRASTPAVFGLRSAVPKPAFLAMPRQPASTSTTISTASTSTSSKSPSAERSIAASSSAASSSSDSAPSSEKQAEKQGSRPNKGGSQKRGGGANNNNNSNASAAPPRLMKRVLHIRRVARVNSGGKVRSITALVVVGNGNGAAGWGEGRATEVAAAVQKATRNAEKSMTSFYRFNKRTIFSNIDYNWHKVQLHLRSAPPGYGVVANNHIHEICRCIGISDLGAKVYGSRNPMNVIKATFEALLTQKRPEDIARARGKKVTDVELAYYGHTSTSK